MDKYELAQKVDAYLSDPRTEVVLHSPGKDYDHTAASMRVRFDGTTLRTHSEQEIKERILACREAYENVGIIGNVIDLMVDFALEDLTIVHPSPKIQNFYINWARSVNLYNLSERILKSIYRDGNVPIIHFAGNMSRTKLNQFRRTMGKNAEKYLIAQEVPRKNRVPINYKILDVARLRKTGGGIFSEPTFDYTIDGNEVKALRARRDQDDASLKQIKKLIGPDIFDALLSRGTLRIDPERLSILYYKKDDYDLWANPMLWRVMDDVKFKSLLRSMDISAAESVINAITVFKLGAMKEGIPPMPEKFARLVELLKRPGKSKTLVWDDLISIETAYPPVENILGDGKYKQVDKDIRAGLGVPDSLLGGEGRGFSGAFLTVKTIMERLETGRRIYLHWLNEQTILIAKSLGFRKPPFIKMRNMSLNNEEVEKRFLLELADRNVISYQTLVERFDENFEIEIERMRREDKRRKELEEEGSFALLKTGKFGPLFQEGYSILDLTQVAPVSDADRLLEPPTSQEREGDGGGRPPGTKRKQDKTRQTRPKGQKQVSSYDKVFVDLELQDAYANRFNEMYLLFASTFAKTKNKKISNIKISENNKIYNAIDRVLCRIDPYNSIEIKNIRRILSEDLATEPPKLDRCVERVKKQRISKFRKEKGRAPNKKEMQEITSSAFAICNASLKKE